MKLGLKGLISAPHTPMHPDGSLNLDAVAPQAEWLHTSGVVGAFVGGTTGEWPSLTVQERLSLVETWTALKSPLNIIAHAGHNCQADSIEIARHAAARGADAVSAIAPSFLKPGSPREAATFFAPIAAAAPDLPFYIYHIPGLTGVTAPIHEQIEICLDLVPNFAGIKFTDPDLFAFTRCMGMFGDRVELMWGVDEILLSALPLGAVSGVGSTYNYAAPLFNAMIEAYEKNDVTTARSLSCKAVQMVDTLMEFGVLRAGKALMTLRGVECGPTRLPVTPLTPAKREQLFERVQALGVIEDSFVAS